MTNETKKTKKILLVDDEEIVITISAEMLEILGYEVTTCKSGKEAINYYRTYWKENDLVLLDMVMPRLTGPEVFEELKKINPKVRVILSSGYNIKHEENRLQKLGISGLLNKPFTLKTLSQAIDQVFQKN